MLLASALPTGQVRQRQIGDVEQIQRENSVLNLVCIRPFAPRIKSYAARSICAVLAVPADGQELLSEVATSRDWSRLGNGNYGIVI